MAILDIEVLVSDSKRRDAVLQDVISKEGPPDGTVVVERADGTNFDDDAVNTVLGILGDVGDIILVR